MPRTALVTGANRGLGAQTAKDLARRGLRVLLGVRDVDAGQSIRSRLDAGDHRVIALDVADRLSIRRALRELADDGIDVDVLVNNAGVLLEGDALAATHDQMESSWRVNVQGAWELMQGVLGGMIARGYGRVVNVSSGGGSFGEGTMMAGHATYAVSKAALNALTVVTASVVSGDVKINAVCPGWVRTRMGGDGAPRSVEEGAAGIVRLATLEADGPHGGFFRDDESIPW